ncbi:MAG: hypothetical protein ACW987_16335, partial [Candidatus Thorarchaeota archaeon]
ATAETNWHIHTATSAVSTFTNWDGAAEKANGNIRLHVIMHSSDTFTFNYNPPTSDSTIDGDWQTQTGTDYYAMIDDARGAGWGAGADTTYVDSPPTTEGQVVDTGSDFLTVAIPVPYSEPNLETANDTFIEDVEFRASHTGDSSGDMKLYFDLWDLSTDSAAKNLDGDTIATHVSSAITDTVANFDVPVNENVSEGVLQNLAVRFYIQNDDAPVEADTDNYPASDIDNTALWERSDTSATTSLFEVLDTDTDYVNKSTASAGVSFTCNWDEAEPTFHSTANPTKIIVRAKATGGLGANKKLTISDDNGTSGWSGTTGILNNNWQTFTFELTPTESDALNWGDIDLKVETTSAVAGSPNYQIDWINLEVPGNRPRIRISAVAVETPGLQGFDVSWANIRMPVDATAAPVDDNQNWIFFGNKTDLFVVDDDTAVTNFSDAFGGGNYPQAWDFASFGENVYATNYVDDIVLWKPATPTALTNPALTGGDAHGGSGTIDDVRCKYLAAVGDHLVIANINHGDYESFSVLFSHFNDPQSFSSGDIGNQSDFQNLTDTAGPITGLLGGEYGLVFKRNSIYRMSYVGPDIIFRFDLVSDNIGTPYNNSIVKVGDNVYFYSESGFYVMPGGGPPQPIGDGKITKFLTDSEFETYSVNSSKHPITLVNDIDIQGAYDQRSQLIWWLYRSKNADYDGDNETWNSDYIIVYNPKEDRWGIIEQDDLQEALQTGASFTYTTDFTAIGSIRAPLGTSNLLTRGVVFGYRDDQTTDQIGIATLSSQYSTEVTFRTKRIGSKALGLTRQGERPKKFVTRGLRPVMYGTPESAFAPTVRFTVYAYQNPWTDTAIATSSEVSSVTGDDGWYEINPINGEFIEVQAKIDKRSTAFTLKDFMGIEIKVDTEGEY